MITPDATVNGRTVAFGNLPPHTSALDWIRDLGFTGAKEGCAEGECGACAILVARPSTTGDNTTEWVCINACLIPAASLEGQDVLTAEGLGSPDDLHPVQREMALRGGSQCGYCTPGFVCSMAAEYYRAGRAADAHPGAADEPEHGANGFDLHAMSGNLCRCTGYRPIRDAAYALGEPAADDPIAQRHSEAAPVSPATRIANNGAEYVRPADLTATLELIHQRPDAVLVAGSTDWGVEVNLRGRRAPFVVGIDQVPELREMRVDDDAFTLGAALTLTELERRLDGAIPLLDEVFPQFASRLIRNGATLGGNLGTASPIGDFPPALLALEAELVLASVDGERTVPLADYFTGYRQTVRRTDELIKAIRIPRPLAPLIAFHKIAKRRFDDISSVAVGYAVRLDGGVVGQARIGLGGIAATPLRALATEAALVGQPWNEATVGAAAEVLAAEGTPIDDMRASAAFRVGDDGPVATEVLRREHDRSASMSHLSQRPDSAPDSYEVGKAIPHESAALHVTGLALYTDDLVARTKDCLHAYPVQVFVAKGKITKLDVQPAYAVPGVVRVLTADDVPGVNDAGVKHDEPLFPSEVKFFGHAVCYVLGETLEAARLGAAAVVVELEAEPSLVNVKDAIEAREFQGAQPTVQRGDVDEGLRAASHVFSGTFEFAGQEHFYLETHCALAHVDEAGQIFVQSSTQHPSETQEIVAHVLGKHNHEITVQCLRMGGGFGGKEMQPHGFAAVAALGSILTGRPVRLRLSRTQDLTMSGKRHGFHAEWRVGFDDDGALVALEATLTADGGWSLDLSEPVLARALCHIDNAYWIPNIRVNGRIAKTNKTSNTAFRGFGGPQGMIVIEDILGRCAPLLGLAPEELRRRNFYSEGQTTPYGQPVRHPERIQAVWDQVHESGDLDRRRAEIAAFNAEHAHVKRAIGVTPVKFGISFNLTAFNQAGALVHVYKDGSVLINHGGTEMGQGLHTKMMQVAATTLGVPLAKVRLAPTRTDKVPNTSATAASSGADLNGGAVKNACEQIRERLERVAGAALGVSPAEVRFVDGTAYGLGHDEGVPWEEVVRTAYFQRVQLFAAGYYRTAGLHWDSATMKGSPFKYFAYGCAATEVEVDGFTGAYHTRRVDIVHDVGDSLSPLVDIGQIEGGFVQGAGWLTLEDLRWDESDGPNRGRLTTQAASTYKLPSFSELPEEFNVTLLERAHEEGAVYGSKAVGEPPLMLAFSVREALRQAAAAFGPEGTSVDLASPATPEAVWWALTEAAKGHEHGHVTDGVDGAHPEPSDPTVPDRHPESELRQYTAHGVPTLTRV